MGEVPETLVALLEGLDSVDPKGRNAAANRLREFAEAAVETIFRAIGRPEDRLNRGSLVFALTMFHCEDRFTDLFSLALHGHYEVQCHALTILHSQFFNVTERQLDAAGHDLERLQERENLPAGDVARLRGELQRVLSRLREST